MAKLDNIPYWREEIANAEKFREEEFGELTNEKKSGAGENIEYYENGFYASLHANTLHALTTVNIIDALASVVIPSLYFKNPKTIALPNKIEAEDSAPLCAKTIDYFRKKLESEIVNQKVIWDAYILGMGVYKIGYATKFGMDIEDDMKKRATELPNRVAQVFEKLGFTKKKDEPQVIRPELDYTIVAESPFISYVNPFDFLIDPRATNINDAQWLGHRMIKTVKELKDNKKYKNTEDLDGDTPETRTLNFSNIPLEAQEAFRTRELYEIHYRNDNRWYLLVLSTKDSTEYAEHYHEETIYDLGEWQFDVLMFKNHGHALYPRSDITKIKELQDRITTTIDSILEQVEKFVPKLAVSIDDVTEEGRNSLKYGGVGALIYTTKDPNSVFKELMFTQLKTDLQALLDQVISLISLQTGITRAQLTGVSDARTATEANIEQGGQNLRLSDMNQMVVRFVNRQTRKLWKIITQFTPLEELQLINGMKGIDEKTGLPKYNWLTVDPVMANKLRAGEYDFDIEVGSTEKVNLPVVRKAFENWFNILARQDVVMLMQQQGKKVDVAELLRKGLDSFPELGIDSSKIIQDITPETSGLIPPEVPGSGGPGGATAGSATNELRALQSQPSGNGGRILQEAQQI